MRAAIGAAMSRSKREIPHYYLAHEVDLGPAMSWLAAHNASRPPSERVLPAALLVRSVALGLQRAPELNAHFVDGRVAPQESIHVGLAIALRGGGLVAPRIERTDTLSLDELMVAMTDLVTRARRGGLRASEMTGATITITSLGDRGVDLVVPAITPPQVAVLGIGTITERPRVVEGQVVPRPVVTISLAADHRVSDGHAGARFLHHVATLLMTPEKL